MLKQLIEGIANYFYFIEDSALTLAYRIAKKRPLAHKKIETYALFHAAKHGRTRLLSEFIRAGAPIDCVNPKGEHLLMTAIQHRNPSIVAQLLRYGIDPNLRQHTYDITPLQLATQVQHPGIIGTLISCGADISARTAQSLTMFDFAATWHNVLDTRNTRAKLLFDIIKPHLFPIAENLCNTIGYGSSQARQVLLLAIQKQYHNLVGTPAGKRLMDHFAKETMALLIA